MDLAILANTPLEINPDGVVIVGKTRVTLDTVIAVFNQGAAPEEIVFRYPSLKLADVRGTIAFYLNHQQEVEAYLQRRQQQAQVVRQMNQAKFEHLETVSLSNNPKFIEMIQRSRARRRKERSISSTEMRRRLGLDESQ